MPLSLEALLELADRARADLENAQIGEIVREFIRFIGESGPVELEGACKFLVVMAELVLLKAQLLLGSRQETEENDGKRILEAGGQEMAHRLDEYRLFRRAAEFLMAREDEQLGAYPRPACLQLWPPGDLSAEDLKNILLGVLSRQKGMPVEERVAPSNTVSSRMEVIRQVLDEEGEVAFERLLGGASAEDLIIVFLAVLELARLGELVIVQQGHFGHIRLRRQVRWKGASW